MIKSFDWSRTAMGAKDTWVPSVRAVVDALASSSVPMISFWGNENVSIYNEAFSRHLGPRHPDLFGVPVLEGWPEAAGLVRPILEAGTHGQVTRLEDVPFLVGQGKRHRASRLDLHCSPVAEDNGSVLGLLCVLVSFDPTSSARRTLTDHRPSRQSLLLKFADDLRFASTKSDVVSIGLAAISEETGAACVGYAEVDPLRDEAVFDDGDPIVGVTKKVGTFPIDRLVLEPESLHQGRSAVAESAARTQAHNGSPARLVVPLVREGRLRSIFLAERPSEDQWSVLDVSLVEDIAGRAWDAIDRVQAAAILRNNQARQGFLLVLGDRLRELEDAQDIMEVTAQSLGQHLRVCQVGYAEVSAHREIHFDTGWSDGSLPPLLGHFSLDSLGAFHVEDLTRGLAATFEPGLMIDTAASVMTDGLATLLAVPLIRDGKLRGALFVGSRTVREWSADELALVGEAAARLWEALERARAEAALHDLNVTLENRVAQRTQELTSSEARFRTLFANAPAPIFLIRVSSTGEAVYDAVNAATERFLGMASAQMSGRAVWERTSTGLALLDLCRQCAQTGQPVNYEISVEGGDGWRTAECVLAPLPIDDVDTQLLIGIARDITGQRQAEEQLRQAQKMEAIGQLTGGIAHDFNNLLTGIIGSLALIEKRLMQGKNDAIGRYLGLAMASANRAAALTHRLLAFSRRQPLASKPVNVSDLVASMDDLLRRTLGESVALETHSAPGTWMTLCDPHQLENALLNLAINARDAMPDGGRLTLRTANATVDIVDVPRDPGLAIGDHVVVSVSDTGTGMPQDVIARAFDPFFTTKPIGQGTGLGLSMIYGFVKQSEGHVKIESEVGVGTTVSIFLPRYRGEADVEAREASGAPPRAEAGETVLVVEDDETVRGLVLDVLRDLGYRAIEAADSEAGLRALLTETRIDLLVTDVGLPGLNGRQLAEQARTHRPALAVLFITGYAENAAFGAGYLESGMQMMTKPFTVDDLATRIRAILGKSNRASSLHFSIDR